MKYEKKNVFEQTNKYEQENMIVSICFDRIKPFTKENTKGIINPIRKGAENVKMRFGKWDVFPVVAVVALAVAVFLLFLPGNAPADHVEIYQNGVLVETISLTEDTAFEIQGEYKNVITIRDGKVAITESSCPGGDCAACGWRETAGSIVCLPNGVEVRVIASDHDVDIVVG